jgi:outer membrane protein assembly factor BamB
MKKLAGLFVVLVLTAAPAVTQTPSKPRVYTSPQLPPRQALERLNLTLAWRARAPVDSRRDGIFSVQVLPRKKGDTRSDQVVVQTERGTVVSFDAETGDTQWRHSLGEPYSIMHRVGYNTHAVFASRGARLFGLDRENGRMRLALVREVASELDSPIPILDRNGLPLWGVELVAPPTTATAADENFLFVTIGDQLTSYTFLPVEPERAPARPVEKKTEEKKDEEKKDEEKKDEEKKIETLPPFVAGQYVGLAKGWTHLTNGPLFVGAPVMAHDFIGAVTADGTFYGLTKGLLADPIVFRAHGKVVARLNHHSGIAYLASDDFNVYAIEVVSGNLLWRFTAGGPIERPPVVLEEDVYVAPERFGLYRLDRDTGRERWQNRNADRYLASNDLFVYALDRLGRLIILDRARGTQLATLDVRGWDIAVSNEWSDRIFLAANDGQVICLRHRDRAAPLRTKVVEDRKPAAKEEEKKPKEDKDKDKDKDVGQLRVPPQAPALHLAQAPRLPERARFRAPDLVIYSAEVFSRGRSMASPLRALNATASVNSM